MNEAHAAVSGSRLKAIWLAAEDGTRQFAFEWLDTEWGTACEFLRASDGKLRCLPSGATVEQSYFGDAACTRRVASAPACAAETGGAPAPRFARLDDGACAGGARVFSIDSGVSQLYASFDNACRELEADPGNFGYFALGEELPPDRFVVAERAADP